MSLKPTFIVGFALLSIVACGPEKSAKDQEKENVQRQERERVAKVLPHAGLYRGVWTGPLYEPKKAALEIRIEERVVRVPVKGNPVGEVIKVPAVAGRIFLADESWNFLMGLGIISSGEYFPDTKMIELVLEPDAGVGSPGRVFSGTLEEGRIRGFFTVNSFRTELDVVKVNTP